MTRSRARLGIVLGANLTTGCAGEFTPDLGATAEGSASDDSTVSSSATVSTADDTATSTSADTGTDGSTDTGASSESSSGSTTGVGCDPNVDPNCPACQAVDVLIVIDNSSSMVDHQEALGIFLPAVADALVANLPLGTDVHVGVTSTEMGYSAGATVQGAPACTATGDGGQPPDAFYVTPVMQDTGKNGAQGRLFDVNGVAFAAFKTDGLAQEIDAARMWLDGAKLIGEGGSQMNMSAAPFGWALDPANAAENAGFPRDEGAVLMLFVIQDGIDLTPDAATQEIVDMVAAAKLGCGGLICVVGGGFTDQACLPEVPLGTLMDGLGASPVMAVLPDQTLAENDPQAAADMMLDIFAEVVEVAAQQCDEVGG